MAIGRGLPDVADPGVSRIPDVSRGAGLSDRARATAWSAAAETARGVRDALDPALQEAGRRAGALAADEGLFHPRRTPFPDAYDISFNAANEAGYLAAKSVDMDARLAELRAANPLDADAFARAAQEARGEDLRDSPPRYMASLGLMWQERAAVTARRIAEENANASLARQREQLTGGLEAAAERALGFADEGELMSASGLQAMAEYEDLHRALADNPLFAIPDAEADAALAIFQERASARSVLHEYLRDGDLRAASEFAQSLGFSDTSPIAKAEVDDALRNWVRDHVGDAEEAELNRIDRQISTAIYLDGDLEEAETLLRANATLFDGDRYKVLAGAIASARDSEGSDDPRDSLLALDLERQAETGALRGPALETALNEGLLDERLTLAQARTIRGAAEGRVDTRTREADDLMRSFFGQGVMDFNVNLAVQEEAAMGELRAVRAANPELTREEERAALLEIAANYRRPVFQSLPPLRGGVRPQTREQLAAARAGFEALVADLNRDADPANDISASEAMEEFDLYRRYEELLELWEIAP